jgi:hypothetical protein
MGTRYVRNGPDDVSERLAALTAREGLSVPVGDLPDLDVSAGADCDARRSLDARAPRFPHLADLEVAPLRSQVLRGMSARQMRRAALAGWERLGVRRFAVVGLLDRIWELRDNVISPMTPRTSRWPRRLAATLSPPTDASRKRSDYVLDRPTGAGRVRERCAAYADFHNHRGAARERRAACRACRPVQFRRDRAGDARVAARHQTAVRSTISSTRSVATRCRSRTLRAT